MRYLSTLSSDWEVLDIFTQAYPKIFWVLKRIFFEIRWSEVEISGHLNFTGGGQLRWFPMDDVEVATAAATATATTMCSLYSFPS